MGCAKYDTAAKLAAQTERMYGAAYSCQVVKKGEEQIIQLFLEYVPESAGGVGVPSAEAVSFLAEVILRPLTIGDGFAADIVDSEKRTLRAQISARKNHKAEYARYRMLEEMCSSEAFAIPGDGYAEDLDTITPASAYTHYRRVLRTSPIDIMLIGDETPEVCAEAVRTVFAPLIIERENVEQTALPQPVSSRALPKKVHEHAPTSQGNLAMGYRADIHPAGGQAYALMLANEVFGGYGSSRLFTVVRERESLAYSVGSVLYRFKGIIAVHAGVDSANFERAGGLVNDQLQQIAQGHITEAELENAKRSLLKKYTSVKDHNGQMLEFYMSQHMLGDTDELDGVIRKIRQVAAEEIATVAANIGIDTVYTLGEG